MMPKQAWTEEERKAFGEKMRKIREDKAVAKEKAEADNQEPVEPEHQAEPELAGEATVSELAKQVLELKAQLERIATAQTTPGPAYVQQTPQMDPRGKLTGTFEKYIVDPKHYPDPTAQLAKEPKLARFAFDVNYELGWEVTRTQYQTQDGINTVEPRFTVELIKVIIDEESGEPTTGRYVLRSMVLHEDPQAALTVARDNNVDPESFGGDWPFLDAMRYLRIRDWLLEAFYPPRNTGKKGRKEAVIGNRLVQLYEVSSLDPVAVDFGAKKVGFGE